MTVSECRLDRVYKKHNKFKLDLECLSQFQFRILKDKGRNSDHQASTKQVLKEYSDGPPLVLHWWVVRCAHGCLVNICITGFMIRFS